MEDLDIYDDLDEFHEQEEKKTKELLLLEEKYNEALKTIEAMKMEKKDLRKKIRIMEQNLQSLLDTAKAEIKRKDKSIEELHREKEDICFRRQRAQQQQQRPDFTREQKHETIPYDFLNDEKTKVAPKDSGVTIPAHTNKSESSDERKHSSNPFQEKTKGDFKDQKAFSRHSHGDFDKDSSKYTHKKNDYVEATERKHKRRRSKEDDYDISHRSRSRSRERNRTKNSYKDHERERSKYKDKKDDSDDRRSREHFNSHLSRDKERRNHETKSYEESSSHYSKHNGRRESKDQRSTNDKDDTSRRKFSDKGREHRRGHSSDSSSKEKHHRCNTDSRREKDFGKSHQHGNEKSSSCNRESNQHRKSKESDAKRETSIKNDPSIKNTEKKKFHQEEIAKGGSKEELTVIPGVRVESADSPNGGLDGKEEIRTVSLTKSEKTKDDINHSPLLKRRKLSNSQSNEKSIEKGDAPGDSSTASPFPKTDSLNQPEKESSSAKESDLFSALFGAHSNDPSTHDLGNLLVNAKEILNQSRSSSATTSPNAYTDISETPSRNSPKNLKNIPSKVEEKANEELEKIVELEDIPSESKEEEVEKIGEIEENAVEFLSSLPVRENRLVDEKEDLDKENKTKTSTEEVEDPKDASSEVIEDAKAEMEPDNEKVNKNENEILEQQVEDQRYKKEVEKEKNSQKEMEAQYDFNSKEFNKEQEEDLETSAELLSIRAMKTPMVKNLTEKIDVIKNEACNFESKLNEKKKENSNEVFIEEVILDNVIADKAFDSKNLTAEEEVRNVPPAEERDEGGENSFFSLIISSDEDLDDPKSNSKTKKAKSKKEEKAKEKIEILENIRLPMLFEPVAKQSGIEEPENHQESETSSLTEKELEENSSEGVLTVIEEKPHEQGDPNSKTTEKKQEKTEIIEEAQHLTKALIDLKKASISTNNEIILIGKSKEFSRLADNQEGIESQKNEGEIEQQPKEALEKIKKPSRKGKKNEPSKSISSNPEASAQEVQSKGETEHSSITLELKNKNEECPIDEGNNNQSESNFSPAEGISKSNDEIPDKKKQKRRRPDEAKEKISTKRQRSGAKASKEDSSSPKIKSFIKLDITKGNKKKDQRVKFLKSNEENHQSSSDPFSNCKRFAEKAKIDLKNNNSEDEPKRNVCKDNEIINQKAKSEKPFKLPDSQEIASEDCTARIDLITPVKRKSPLISNESHSKEYLHSSAEVKAMLINGESPLNLPDSIVGDDSSNTATVRATIVTTAKTPIYDDLDRDMQKMFQSPAKSHLSFPSTPIGNSTLLSNTTIDETVNINNNNNSILENASGAATGVSSLDSSMEKKRLSLGSSQYVIERVSENVVNLVITRRSKKKRRDNNST